MPVSILDCNGSKPLGGQSDMWSKIPLDQLHSLLNKGLAATYLVKFCRPCKPWPKDSQISIRIHRYGTTVQVDVVGVTQTALCCTVRWLNHQCFGFLEVQSHFPDFPHVSRYSHVQSSKFTRHPGRSPGPQGRHEVLLYGDGWAQLLQRMQRRMVQLALRHPLLVIAIGAAAPVCRALRRLALAKVRETIGWTISEPMVHQENWDIIYGKLMGILIWLMEIEHSTWDLDAIFDS